MTGRGPLSLRVRVTLDRLAWGFSDLRRAMVEHGIWPASARIVVSADGGHWSVIGTRLRASAKRRKATGLLVPETNCLWGTMQLPSMPRLELNDAVQEALWRVSPLSPEHVVATWDAVPAPQNGWAVVWGVCKRSDQDDLLTQQGLASDAAVYLAYHGRAFAVRGKEWQRQLGRQRWVDGILVGSLLFMLGALSVPALMPLVLQRQAVVRAVQHVSMLEPKAAPLRQQLDELRQQAQLAQELQQSMSTVPPLASVVDRLSEALPDDASLDRIEVNNNEIRIAGLTGNATELIAHLGRHPAFAEVRATVANVRDNTLNKERFTFEMRWRGEGVKP